MTGTTVADRPKADIGVSFLKRTFEPFDSTARSSGLQSDHNRYPTGSTDAGAMQLEAAVEWASPTLREDSALFVALALLLLVLVVAVVRDVDVVVPILLHEVDRLTTRVVLAAMLPPIFRVAGRDMKVNRSAHNANRYRLNDYRLGIDQLGRWNIANVNATIVPGFADVNRHAYFGPSH